MCPNCEAFADERTFRVPADYVAFVCELMAETSGERMVLVYGDCPLEDLKNAPPWPAGDVILHEVRCTRCGQYFQLCVNVWNGRNWWTPQSPEQWDAERHYHIKQVQ